MALDNRTYISADADTPQNHLQWLVERDAPPETNRIRRALCRRCEGIEALNITGAQQRKQKQATGRGSPTHATQNGSSRFVVNVLP
jgi:hypothetical protein